MVVTDGISIIIVSINTMAICLGIDTDVPRELH